MPQTFTNRDLNKPLSQTVFSKSKTFTNKDLENNHPPDILDNAMDDEQIASPPDIMDDEAESTITEVNQNEPDTWMKGFINSITSGDALDAGMSGLKGFAKGATLDIPASIYGGLKSVYNLVTNPKETISNIPSDLVNMASGIGERFSKAGSEPEEFGRMMGNITGQPLTTYGLAKATPSIVRGTGAAVEGTGRVMRRYAPLTGMPIISPLAGRNLVRAERMVGRGLESVGKKMRGKSTPTPAEGLTSETMPVIQEGESVVPKKYKVIRNENPPKPSVKRKVRPNGDGTFTDLTTGELLDSKGQSIIEYGGKPIDRNSPFFTRNRPSQQ